uniref:Endonuclease/exonuclease/phosphatase domain-containing protein n=1 Tax=Cannabis sativa TaxID=3483 RepID=A0A803PN17_CANSA
MLPSQRLQRLGGLLHQAFLRLGKASNSGYHSNVRRSVSSAITVDALAIFRLDALQVSPDMISNADGIAFPFFGLWMIVGSSYPDYFMKKKALVHERASRKTKTILFETQNDLLSPDVIPTTMTGAISSQPPSIGPSQIINAGGMTRIDRSSRTVATVGGISRMGKKATHRSPASLGIPKSAAWVPKSKHGGGAPKISGNGNGVQAVIFENGKGDACFPDIALRRTFDGSSNDAKNSNSNQAPFLEAVNESLHETQHVRNGIGLINSLLGPNCSNQKRIGLMSLEVYGDGPSHVSTGLISCGLESTNINNFTSVGPTLSNYDLRRSVMIIGGQQIPDRGPIQMGGNFNRISGFPNYTQVGHVSLEALGPDGLSKELVEGQDVMSGLDEKKALTSFFQAQETLLRELKQFGNFELYEIKLLGGDIGIKPSSETNERTTPFKKQKFFEPSASLCSRPHNIIRRHPRVVRDFPWDTEENKKANKIGVEDPSEGTSCLLFCPEGAMRGIAWNCRGLGQTSTVRELKSLIRARSPDFVFLTELKVDAAPLVRLLKSMHFYFNIFVPPVGTAGGIILLWKYGFSFECIACSRNHISGIVYSDPPSHPWLLSYVYGPPYFHAKKQFWLDIMKLGDKFGGPWLILGDTNFVLSHSERQGSSGTDQFIPFISSLVESRGLINLLIQGDQLTWDNHRAGRSHVKSALDKGIVNVAWLNLFPKSVSLLSRACNSDHRPLCLMTNGMEGKVKRGFKFEEGWTRDNRSNLVVDQAWNSVFHPWAPARAFRRVGATRVALLHWNRTQYGKMDTVIKELENKLNWVQSLPAGSRDWTTERSIRRSLNDALERKDMS